MARNQNVELKNERLILAAPKKLRAAAKSISDERLRAVFLRLADRVAQKVMEK